MPKLKVMTFNVRQMDGDDGAHAWECRKDVLADTIRMHRPALIGTQETWEDQTEYILSQLPHYRAFGRGRFGDSRDKHNKVFYDPQCLTVRDTGEIWISMTPDIPGTTAWGIASPRMISWGIMTLDSGPEICVMNTHFPYGRSADEARRQTARLILEKIASLPAEMPVILTGDFNAKTDGEVYQMLTTVLRDAWTTADHTAGPEGTLHAFGKLEATRRLDWILYRHAWRVCFAETVTYTSRGLYPSDHYPVCASFDVNFTGKDIASN